MNEIKIGGTSPDVLAPNSAGTAKRKRLVDDMNNALLRNSQNSQEDTSLIKQSFFCKRLRRARQTDENKKSEPTVEFESTGPTKSKEIPLKLTRQEIQSSPTVENCLAASAVNVEIIEPVNNGHSQVAVNDSTIDIELWLPSKRDGIDAELWSDLPPEIQWELRQHFRRCGNETPSKNIGHNGNRRNKKATVNNERRNTTERNQSNGGRNEPDAVRTITDYFQRI